LEFGAYLRWMICIFELLVVIPVFLSARFLWSDRMAGLVGSLIYILSVPSFGRSVGSYLREEFVLPFLFISIFLFLMSYDRGSIWMLVTSGICMLISLSMWHTTPFFFLIFILFLIAFSFIRSDDRLAGFTLIFAVFAFAAGLLNGPLRSRNWILSLPMLSVYSFGLTWLIAQKANIRGKFQLPLFVLIIMGLFLLVRLHAGPEGYSHVYSLIVAKLRFLGIPPDDPALVNFDVRALWVGPFDSPNIRGLCIGFFFPFLLSAYPAYRFISSSRKRGSETSSGSNHEDSMILARSMILLMAIAFIPLFLLFRRLEVFLIFFLSVIAAGAWMEFPRWGKVFLLLVLLFMGSEAWRYDRGMLSGEWWARIFPPSGGEAQISQDQSLSDIFELIDRVTEPDAVIIARYPISPMILAYTGRKVVVHAIFESSENRRKIEEVTSSFFRPEEELLDLSNKLGAQYLLYEANTLFDNSSGSDRYMTANMDINPDWVAFKMHFFPEHMNHFCLVGQTRYFRLFKTEEKNAGSGLAAVEGNDGCTEGISRGAHGVGPDGSYSPQFDPSFFGVRVDRVVDDDQMKRSLASIAKLLGEYNRSFALYRSRRYLESSQILVPIVKQIPRMGEARLLLYRNLIQLGNQKFRQSQFSKASVYFSEAAKLRPEDPLPHLLIGSSYASQGKFELAEAEFLNTLTLDPENSEACEKLGMIYLERRDIEKARSYLERSLEIDPNQRSVRELLRSIDEHR